MLMNIAPVVPKATLAALERATASGEITWANDAVYLLRSLAWEADLFERSIALLAKIANGETKSDAGRCPDRALPALFLGHARAARTANWHCGRSYPRPADTVALRRIGLLALGGLLEGQLRSGFHFQFGVLSPEISAIGLVPATRCGGGSMPGSRWRGGPLPKGGPSRRRCVGLWPSVSGASDLDGRL